MFSIFTQKKLCIKSYLIFTSSLFYIVLDDTCQIVPIHCSDVNMKGTYWKFR